MFALDQHNKTLQRRSLLDSRDAHFKSKPAINDLKTGYGVPPEFGAAARETLPIDVTRELK